MSAVRQDSILARNLWHLTAYKYIGNFCELVKEYTSKWLTATFIWGVVDAVWLTEVAVHCAERLRFV